MNSLSSVSGRSFPAKRVYGELRRLTGCLNGSKLKALASVRPEGRLEGGCVCVLGGRGGDRGSVWEKVQCRNVRKKEKDAVNLS